MCPRPEGWSNEKWRAYQDRRGGRMLIMGEYVTSRVANGMSHSDAFNEMEAALYSGELSLEDGLEEATERWVRSVRAKRGH